MARILKDARCTCAGVLTDQTQETLEGNALGVSIRIFGGALTVKVDEATHLVARQKSGWKNSSKIRHAALRQQVAVARCLPRATSHPLCQPLVGMAH